MTNVGLVGVKFFPLFKPYFTQYSDNGKIFMCCLCILNTNNIFVKSVFGVMPDFILGIQIMCPNSVYCHQNQPKTIPVNYIKN